MRTENKIPIELDRARARIIVSAVAMEFSVPEFVLSAHHKGSHQVSYARQIAMYLMRCVYGSTKQRIADVFERHYTTVSHACKLIEDHREDPVLDEKLLSLENFLCQAPQGTRKLYAETASC